MSRSPSGEGPGTGGSGAAGGRDSGGFIEQGDIGETAGDGGMCEGGAGNASSRNGTGVCLLMIRSGG